MRLCINILRKEVKMHTPYVYIMCTEYEISHEIYIYIWYINFSFLLQNVYT
jgi:hypothetical protein